MKGRKGNSEIILFYILLIALSLRLYFFVGPNLNDDIYYIKGAYRVSRGDFYPIYYGSINEIRTMVTLPIALSFFLFGVNILTASFYPLLCSLLTIVVVYFLGKLLFNERVGLIAAALLSFFPLDIAYSTQIVPTTPLTLYIFLSLLVFLYADKLKKSKRKNKNILYVLSGVILGLGYLTNILVLISFVFFLVYFFFERKLSSKYFLFALGFILIVLVEFSFMFLKTGNPLQRLIIIHNSEETVETITSLEYYPRVMLKLENINFTAHEGNLGLYFYLFIFSSLFLIGRRQKEFLFLLISFILIMGYLQFGVMTLGFKPIAKWLRYLIMLGPIFSLVISDFIYKAFKKTEIQILAVIIIFLISVPFIIGSVNEYRICVQAFTKEFYVLNKLPEKTIYTDIGSKVFLDFYFSYERDIKSLEIAKLEEINDSYVIIDGSHGIIHYKPMRDKLPDFAKNPPADWVLIESFEASRIEPKIYYVK